MTEQSYKYQPGDVVEILPEPYFTWSNGELGGQFQLGLRVGEHLRVIRIDGDGDVVGSGVETDHIANVSPECLKPIEIQGVRVGDQVIIKRAYFAESIEGTVQTIAGFDLEQEFGEDSLPNHSTKAHPFVFKDGMGFCNLWAAEVEKVDNTVFASNLRIGALVDQVEADIHELAERTVTPAHLLSNPTLKRWTWSEIGIGDVVTAEWIGLKNGVESSAVVTSAVVKGRLGASAGGAEWYGQDVHQLSVQSGLWKILEVERAPRPAAERRKLHLIKIVRRLTTGGRWDPYQLETHGRAYVEGVPSGAGDGKFILTAVFNDGLGNVEIKDNDIVYAGDAPNISTDGDFWRLVGHDELFDLTHYER